MSVNLFCQEIVATFAEPRFWRIGQAALRTVSYHQLPPGERRLYTAQNPRAIATVAVPRRINAWAASACLDFTAGRAKWKNAAHFISASALSAFSAPSARN